MGAYLKFMIMGTVTGIAFIVSEKLGIAVIGFMLAAVIPVLLIIFIIKLRKGKKNMERGKTFFLNSGMFDQVLLKETTGLLEAPEFDKEAMAREFSGVIRQRVIKTLMVFPVFGLLFAIPSLNGPLILICGLSGCVLALTGIGLRRFVPPKLRQLYGELEKLRNIRLGLHPRPSFNINDPASLDRFCRYYQTVPEALVALKFAELAQVDYLIYPGDSMRVICGPRFPGVLAALRKNYHFFPLANEKSLQDLIDKLIGNCSVVLTAAELPEPPAVPHEPPPVSYALTDFADTSGSIKKLRTDIKKRPAFAIEEFCFYWPTRETAATALALRQIAIDQLGLSKEIVFYPNDPFAVVLGSSPYDSLDSLEFVMALEEHFGIKITDEETGKFFQFTFADVVRYIMAKPPVTPGRPF